MCSSPAHASWPTRTAKNSLTLGTFSSYVASTLKKYFQVLFVNYVPNTPVGCTDINLSELIKLKGNLAFLKKPKSPSGATTGGIPSKWSHFFPKIREHAKYIST
jgi:hypothetical protein